MMTETAKQMIVWTELAFDKDGKQAGVLHLPYSVTRSAYGMIDIPIAVIKNGDGLSVLLMAGNHGEEYEGQISLSRLMHELEPRHNPGRIIILPAANLPAAIAGARISPLDSSNLNRAFPGEPDTAPTRQIAHYIDSVLVPMCSALLDLHSGGDAALADRLILSPHAAFYSPASLADLRRKSAESAVAYLYEDRLRNCVMASTAQTPYDGELRVTREGLQ